MPLASRKYCAAIAVAAWSVIISTNAVAQTIDSALSFIKTVSSRGTTEFWLKDNDGMPAGSAVVTEVHSQGCISTFMGTTPGRAQKIRIIDWGKISDISDGEASILIIKGQIITGSRTIISSATFEFESPEMRSRVESAMNFLIDHCDKTKDLGF